MYSNSKSPVLELIWHSQIDVQPLDYNYERDLSDDYVANSVVAQWYSIVFFLVSVCTLLLLH